MTDSSSDSDCFESADEGIDDESNDNQNSGIKNRNVGQSEQPNPSAGDSFRSEASEAVQDSGKLSVQYRKRPERVKNSPKATAPTSSKERKTSLKEQIFKSDIIKPDALIQDITSNLSKNINKGFSTITQTSTSIKDLVINSLPLPAQKGSLGKFSYDDEEEIISDSSDSDDMLNEPETYIKPYSEESYQDARSKTKLDIEDSQPVTSTINKTIVDEPKPDDPDVCLGIDAIQISDAPSLPPENEPVELLEDHEETISFKDAKSNVELMITHVETPECDVESESDVQTKECPEVVKNESFNDEIIKSETEEIKKDSENINNDNIKLEVMNDEVVKDDVVNEKDGWDSSDIDLDELNVEENPTDIDTGVESKVNENKNISKDGSKEVESISQGSDDYEGWDDFDINDDELNDVSKNISVDSFECQSAVDIREQSFNEGDINSNVSNDTRWTGWDNFGEKQESKKSGWGLGGWGVNALLNTATSVTQGLSNVLEAGLGAPDPETLARLELEAKNKGGPQNTNTEQKKENSPTGKDESSSSGINLFPSFGLSNLVAGVTKNIVENTKVHEIGSKVISGGLDTLESFGKKTMEVLQEGDPGLRKKRALLLGNEKPVLSQILREAKTKAEIEDRKMEERQMAKMCHFETLFDDFQGLIHLEALEMLSTQCELKIEQMKSSLPKNEADELVGILDEVKELCSIDENDFAPHYSTMVDFKILLNNAVEPMKNEISITKIIHVYEGLQAWLRSDDIKDKSPQILCQKAMSTLAELTAATVQQFHKAGELLSVKEHRKTVEEADTLLQLTECMCCEIKEIAEKFSKVHTSRDTESDTLMARKIKEEAVNATSYIKDAFNLLIPVLQLGAAT
ncbi:UNVERIFIED_CONTAM: hypothetical protein PYX00_005724 [Menopon gallinae]|uniref:Protein FAM114A2 n=1 Tax=Menopon gallinae TaxID=328185 RepID=A0AAW2HSI3_9NEOP